MGKTTAGETDVRGPQRVSGWILTSIGAALLLAAFVLLLATIRTPNAPMAGAASGLAGIGVILYNRGRQSLRPTGQEVLADTAVWPVFYLRSFRRDVDSAQIVTPLVEPQGLTWNPLAFYAATEEEQIVGALSPIGPVVALGQPGETLPPIGAARLYFDEQSWKSGVASIVRRATLNVLFADDTESVLWEFSELQRIASPAHVMLLVPSDLSRFSAFADRLRELCQIELELPREWPASRAGAAGSSGAVSVSGAVLFNADWSVRAYCPFVFATGAKAELKQPLRQAIRAALKPYFDLTQTVGVRPAIVKRLALALASAWVTGAALAFVSFLGLVAMTSPWVEWEPQSAGFEGQLLRLHLRKGGVARSRAEERLVAAVKELPAERKVEAMRVAAPEAVVEEYLVTAAVLESQPTADCSPQKIDISRVSTEVLMRWAASQRSLAKAARSFAGQDGPTLEDVTSVRHRLVERASSERGEIEVALREHQRSGANDCAAFLTLVKASGALSPGDRAQFLRTLSIVSED